MDGLKTPFVASINRTAIKRASDAIQAQGRALPCSVTKVTGQIVTVSFDVKAAPFTLPPATIPIATSRYDWIPVQIGDQGVVMPADAVLGGVSGLGGVADLTTPGNLEALVFMPVSNAGWQAPADVNKRIVQGPDGATVQDIGQTAVIDCSNGKITMSAGGHTIVIDSTGVIIDGHIFNTHEHTGVQSGTSLTGGVA